MFGIKLVIGMCVLLTVLANGCGQDKPTNSKTNLPPKPSFTVSPLSGKPGAIFTVDASSSLSKTGTELMFRWDWEDDEVWDTDFSTEPFAEHSYESLGYKKIRLEVMDEKGSSTTRKEVFITVASKEMMLIPAGEFVMGSPDGVGNDDEHPQHRVYLDAFLMGRFEVTNNQYVEFLNAIGRNEDDEGNELVNIDTAAIRSKEDVYSVVKGWEDKPVVGVSWHGAKAYAEWEGGRLPTEAEWEKAARGENSLEWPWGDSWETGMCNTWESDLQGPAAVGSYPMGASPYGVEDLIGNVYEWLADWYQDDYYAVSPSRNPKGPETGVFRVLRGGSWAELEDKSRVTARFGQRPIEGGDSDFGFRIVKDVAVDQEFAF
jgi:formylglycine-generating enzyme required for sulfatase activity